MQKNTKKLDSIVLAYFEHVSQKLTLFKNFKLNFIAFLIYY